MKYFIYDWAGNCKHEFGSFNTFEAAWEFLYIRFPEEESLEEWEVINETLF